MKKIAICTISSHNYMSYGITCLMSAKAYNPFADMFYLVADKFRPELYKNYNDNISFIDLYSIGIEKEIITNMAFKYNIVEFNTAVKPAFYSYLLNKGFDTVIYLDPDIECYSSFDYFLKRNDKYSIIVTPHKTSPISSQLIEDKAFLNNGIYNLGFITLNKSESTFHFLKWWNEKLRTECFIDYSKGMATDQIWVELASTIFDRFQVDKDLGLNAAFWNIHERKISNRDGDWLADKTSLVFFHFSSLSVNCNKIFLENIDRINPGFNMFYSDHIERVKQNNLDQFSNIEYSFLRYDNGEIISKGVRWLYGFSNELQKKYSNPFDTKKGTLFSDVLSSRAVYKQKTSGIDNTIKIMVRVLGVKRTVKMLSKASTSGVRHISALFELE